MAAHQEEWGPWISHDGKGCPVPIGTMARLEWADGWQEVGEVEGSGAWTWGDLRDPKTWSRGSDGLPILPIIRYQIKKPLGLQMLEAAMRSIPKPVIVTVDE